MFIYFIAKKNRKFLQVDRGIYFNGWQLAKMKKSIPEMSLP